MGVVRESSGGEPTPSEKKRKRQRMVREEVAEGTLHMKRMRGKSEAVMGGDGGDVGERASGKRPSKEEGETTSKKARKPDGLTIREGQAMGGGDSANPGTGAAREPSGKSKRKVAAEEGDGQKKPRSRKTAEAASGGERPVGEECDEAATFWLDYERNDGGEIVEKELPVQLLIDPRKVCNIPPWERYYNHHSLSRGTVDEIKDAMLSQFSEKTGKIWTKNPLVLAPIYKLVARRPDKADRVHKDVFKPEDKDKYYYYPVNGQHTVAAVKELEGEPIFDLWKMNSWPARWMSLVTAGDDVFRKAMEFYAKWAEGKLLGGEGKTPLSRPGKYMPDRSPGQQAIPEIGLKGAAGETKMGWLVQVPPPPTKKKTQANDKFFVVVKEPDMFCWQCLADMTDVEKLSILDDVLALRRVFVQSAGGHLKRQHKPGIKDMVTTRKVDRVMLHMLHYILFLETEEDERVWRYGSPFFRTEGWLLEEFGPQGLMKQVWVEMRKHFMGAVEYVKTCKRTLPHEKESLDDVKKLYDDDRTEVWDFLFQPGPPGPTDLEYNRRRNLVFGVLNGYHDAPRESVSHFLRRLEHVYFTLAEPLTLENYKSQFDEEDPFDAEDMEELSDPETFDFKSMPLPRVVGQVGDEEEGGPRRYSMSPAGLKRVFRGDPVDDHSSDDGDEERDYDHEPCDRLPEDHDTWQNDRLYFFGKHHRFTAEDVSGHNVVWHPRIFQPAVKNGMWVMAMKEADGKWSGLKRLGAGAFKRTGRHALVEHLSLINPERNDPDVAAYAEQKLNELYANNMLEFRAPFYTLETALSRGIDWRTPQPPSSGQHPGGGGGGDEGDGGGDGGDNSQFAGKGTGKTSSVEKASDGKGSGGKDSGGKGSGGKGSGGKGSGGKGSGGKGSGGKRRTSGSPQYRETDPHCVGSRDSDMRDEATLKSDQVRVDSHLSARTLFPVAEESPSRCAQQRFLVLNTLLLKEGASSFCLEDGMPALRRSEGVLETGGGEYEHHTPREEERSPGACAIHREEETQHWQSRKVLETGGSECERHASEGPSASMDTDSESAGAPGETHALQRGEETRHWPPREDVKGLHARALVIGTSKEVLHSRSGVATTREGVVMGGQWTFVQAPVLGDDEDEKEPAVEARVHGDEKGGEPVVEGGEVTVGIQTDPQRKDGDSSLTRCGEEQGGRASVLSTARGMVLHEAIELGDDSAATKLVSDSGVAEMQNVESSVEGGEVAVNIKMDPERKNHDSPSTRCGAEQGDRAFVLSTGREMVLHEAIDLPSDSAATELVSDTVVAEVQNLELSVDVGAVARQEGKFPQRAPEHGKICE
ncbi:hypothetical protein CBR_g31732 [Chara braunii]|uniref:Uncharacterized protein n=1 Tax=Chara braunii TaxID=69332 RepID=A0A388JY71_CHABU|nr:hypothetical protein CBR_g31732 [Chara braunii]|eukprot:GBG62715.1 hypothetical protein CBR_g31732 [Chara braunii]